MWSSARRAVGRVPVSRPVASPSADELLFLPLGGVGEIGMNLALFGHDGAWLIVDIGITFGGDVFPDYPVMMAAHLACLYSVFTTVPASQFPQKVVVYGFMGCLN